MFIRSTCWVNLFPFFLILERVKRIWLVTSDRTVTVVADDALLLKLLSPMKEATMLWARPLGLAVKLLTVKVALPVVSTGTTARTVSPSLNVTFPLGIVPWATATVAVSTTG